MPIPTDLPVVDHHCHLSPHGEGVGAARRFASAGGTHLFLATQNYLPAAPRTLDEYRIQFETTEALARMIRAEIGVEAYLVVAPYPIDLVTTAPELGVGPALDLHRRALDLAGSWVREHRAVALGEVGLPHFEVPPDLAEAVSFAFDHALAVARDVELPGRGPQRGLDAGNLSGTRAPGSPGRSARGTDREALCAKPVSARRSGGNRPFLSRPS